MPSDNYMHHFAVEISHHDYENIQSALDGTVADEIAQVIIEYLPALKVSVRETNYCPECGVINLARGHDAKCSKAAKPHNPMGYCGQT